MPKSHKKTALKLFRLPENLCRHCEPCQSKAWQSPKIIFNMRSEVKNNFRVAYKNTTAMQKAFQAA
ncbi:MAG: hypothetical protein IIU35_03500 [Neisseriaceae bacterium]|nr:hypothetical protein [Neisseriaceae bacterium]